MDHLDHVDPVGQWFQINSSIEFKWRSESTLTYIIFTSATDGVILVDPEYLKDRKGELESIFVMWHECIEMAILISQ